MKWAALSVLLSVSVDAQPPDPNELLCFSLALEMMESGHVSREQADAWLYLGCESYKDKIAPAVAAYLGSKSYSDRWR